jgi:hypothetical protein
MGSSENISPTTSDTQVCEQNLPRALLTLIDPFTREYRQRIVDFAAQRHLPAIYDAREFVQSGGLIS